MAGTILVGEAGTPPAVSQDDEWAGERELLWGALEDHGLPRIRRELGSGPDQASLLKFAQHYLNTGCGTNGSMAQALFALDAFLGGLGGGAADRAIKQASKPGGPKAVRDRIQAHVARMKGKGRDCSPGYVAHRVSKILVFYKVNDIVLPHIEVPRARTRYADRSPSAEELAKVLDVADVRERAIVSMLALTGLRVGTLALLRYRHVRRDLEAGTVPIHIHVESAITKGRYADFDTFAGAEAAETLKAYLDLRRRGHGDFPPEVLTDSSPLIRSLFAGEIRDPPEPISGVTAGHISQVVRDLLRRAGLIDGKGDGPGKRHRLRPHSIRKYFRTRLGAEISADTVEYFMGHKGSTYLDIASRGVEDLRQEYAKAAVSIRPKPAVDARDTIREMIRRLGGDPDKAVLEGVFLPHRTVLEGRDAELRDALRELLVGMLREPA